MIGSVSPASPSLVPTSAEPAALIANVVLGDPIAAPAGAQAALPANADITLYVAPSPKLPAISGPPAFEVTAVSVNGIVVDLSDGYSLAVDELRSGVFVANAKTSEKLQIWGAAQIELGGADAARFWGTTSVELGNGTKITLETAKDTAMADLFRLDRLTVTRDDRAMVISGVSSEKTGDLTVVQSRDGYAIDDDTRDGLTLAVDSDGEWTDEYGDAVTQATFDKTAPGELYGPGSTRLSVNEIATVVSRFFIFGQVTSMMSNTRWAITSETNHQDTVDAARAADLRRAHILYAGATARGVTI